MDSGISHAAICLVLLTRDNAIITTFFFLNLKKAKQNTSLFC